MKAMYFFFDLITVLLSIKLKKLLFIFIAILVSFSESFCEWKWLNPHPQGNSLNDIIFIDTGIGWTVGNYGTLLKIVDSNNSFTLINTKLQDNLNSIDFVNNSIGWVCGSGGAMLYTVNSGEDWEVKSKVTNRNLQAIDFYDSDFGIAVGDSGVILKTTDGGNSWIDISIETISNLIDVQIINRDVIYTIVNNNIFSYSEDGGNSWENVVLKEVNKLYKMTFFDADKGIVCGSYGAIANTEDGGKSWNYIFNGTSSEILSISFSNDMQGIAVGKNGLTLFSGDSGKSWTINNLKTVTLKSVAHFNSQVAYAASENGNIYKTTNAGYDWEIITKNITNNNFISIFFIDSANGWAGSNLLYKTTDGGDSWEQTNTGFEKEITSINDIKFIDANNGCIAVRYNQHLDRGKAYFTDDGGKTWREKTYPYLPFVPNSICYLNKEIIFIAGNELSKKPSGRFGYVSKSTDGGLVWSNKNLGTASPFEYDYLDIAFADSLNGYIVGGCSFINTTDCGATWHVRGSRYEWFKKLFFLDEQFGWRIGRDYYSQNNPKPNTDLIHKTTDGGKTWSNILTDSIGFGPDDIFFIDKKNGWTTTEKGIFRTSDGGYSWIIDNLLTNRTFNRLFFPNGTTGYAVGNYGAIMKYNGEILSSNKEINHLINDDNLAIYPNPATNKVIISFYKKLPGYIKLVLFDSQGLELQLFLEKYLDSGNQTIEILLPKLASGMYFIKVISQDISLTYKLIKE